MTYKEFKLYCICFCEKYKGKTFGEVFPDVCHDIIKDKIEFEKMVISKSNNMYEKENFRLCILETEENLLYLTDNNSWNYISDTILNFEDIV